MGFATPIYLLALASIPLVVLYHVFRPKSTKVAVSSVVLWQKALTVAGRHSAWDRVIRNLLLIVQVLVVIVCALVLSGFFVDKMVLRPQRYLMIIDTSASMAATDVKPDRLTAVKAAAVSYLRALRDNSEVALFDMNSTTTRLLDYTDDLASVERAISELNVRNTSTDPESLVSLLTAIAQDRSQAVTVALFTDGNFRLDEKRMDFDALRSLPIDVFSVGGGGDNVAITSLEIRRPAYGEGPGEVFAVVENFGRERRVFEIVMYHGVRVIRSEYIDLAPQERRVITQGLPSVTTTPVRLDILLDDDLHLDNSADTRRPHLQKPQRPAGDQGQQESLPCSVSGARSACHRQAARRGSGYGAFRIRSRRVRWRVPGIHSDRRYSGHQRSVGDEAGAGA